MRSWRRLSLTIPGVVLALALGWAPAWAQSLRGTVTDSATQRPLEGALVTVLSTGARAGTSAGGEYLFQKVQPGTLTVRAQMIGYAPMDLTVAIAEGDEARLDFSLKLRPVKLEEIVVVGYGEQNRENLSTAVSSISAQDLAGQAVASVDAALQGKATGVFVSQNAGNPGNAITVRVRGTASLTANSQPLYVVDGVPIVSEDITQMGLGGQGMRAASALNADEIQSIDVLKDAAAASIYGSRGSNGVVLITTKRGSLGKPVVTFNAYTGVQRASNRLALMNSTQYITYFNESAENDGLGPDYYGAVGVADSINTDWQDAIFRSAPIGNTELAVAGGNDAIRYRISGNYFEQKGVVIGSNYRRLGGRVNLDFKASEKLTFSTNLALSGENNLRVESDGSLDGVVGNAVGNQPMFPTRLANGKFTSRDDGLRYTNSLAIAHFNNATARTNTMLGNVEARWQVADALKATGRIGVDLYTVRETKYESPEVVGQYAASVSGVAQRSYSLANKYVFEGFLTWDRAWSRHALQVTAGSSLELNRDESDYLRGETLSDATLHEVDNATTITVFGGTQGENNLVSYFGRVNYTLAEKYLFGASMRADGSSVFGRNHRYGYFPGASAAWVLSREPFLNSSRLVDVLKLRASYGLTGNQAVDNYPYQRTSCTSNYGSEPGYSPCTIGNPDLKWERTTQVDVGFDLDLWRGRVSLTGDWYHKKTNDLLVDKPVAGNSGYTSILTNVGNIVNKGFEFALTTVNLQPTRADGFRWATTLNASFNRNRVTKLFHNQPFSTGVRLINRVEVGQPLGVFQAYKFLGVDPATGDAIYKDVNGDGQITSADRTIVGSPWPDFTGGFTSDMTWKGFDLTAFFQFSKGNEIFNGMKIFALSGGWYPDNEFTEALNRWQQPGDITNEPRASYYGLSGAREISSRFIEDGSYLRLQELTVGYQLPERFAASAGFSNARVYVRAHNLFTATGYSGYNPDVNSNGSTANISLGTDFYAYPLARTWSFGVQAAW